MVYCIAGFSVSPRSHVSCLPIDDDGSDFKFKGALLPNGGELPWKIEGGFRLTPQTAPSSDSVYRFARLNRARKTLPDYFLLSGAAPCTAQPVRDCIEALELDIHQFFSLTILQPDMENVCGNYYILNVCQMLDSIILEKSSLEAVIRPNGSYVQALTKNGKAWRTGKRSAVEGYHLWREKIYPSDIYISDMLYDIFMRNKFKGIDKHNFVKVDLEG